MNNVVGSARVNTFLLAIGREVRPRQWYKQGVLFIPVIFALSAFDLSAWIRTGLGAVAFSAVAGGVYILNDIVDREEDRNHPTKQHRPIASGELSVRVAGTVATVFLATGLVLGWTLTPLFFAVLLGYLGQNVLYSLWLKQVLLVDLFIVSIGFVLRAFGGIVLIDTTLSSWMFLSVFLAALMLSAGKRRTELEQIEEAGTIRETLDRYSVQFLDFIIFGVSTTLLIAYSLYTFFVQGIVMMMTIPFAFYAVFRYVYNVRETDVRRPRDALFEPSMVINFVFWGLVVLFALYVYPSLPV